MKDHSPWLDWAVELQALAQAGLHYGKDPFDIERFQRVRDIAAEMLAYQSDLPLEKVKDLFCDERGYQTPKLDTRAAVFQGERILLVRERDGVRYYNDSIASSPSRTIAGLNSFPEKVILIAGGKDKGISYDSLGPVVNDHVKLLILCGATAGVIRASVEGAENYRGLEMVDVEDYHQAVSLARSRAVEGDVVILSPASTSFDRFANFMERGRVFKEIVNGLK